MKQRNTTSKQILLFTVNNDAEGKAQITNLRNAMRLSKSPLRVILYGRGHRFGKGRIHVCKCGGNPTSGPRTCGCRWFDNSFQSHVPLDKAEKIAVFVKGKGNPSYE